MLKKFLHILPTLIIVIAISSCTQIPSQIGQWRVESGDPGNPFYQIPRSQQEQMPPPEKLINIVKVLAPAYTEISSWQIRNNNVYRIRAKANYEEYDYYLSLDGMIYAIEYENDSTHIDEEADDLIIKGTKRAVPLDQVPAKTLKTLSLIIPDSTERQSYAANTIAGIRYIVKTGEIVFYARPDGQIQAAGLIDHGALNEIDPSEDHKLLSDEQTLSQAQEILSSYRQKFNINNQINILKEKQSCQNGSFRFVVLGDSRSNPDLWSNMLTHISLIDPQPDFIINSGDIVSRGLSKEYIEYFIPPLLESDIPIFIAIGNHDDGYSGKAIEYRYLFGDNALNYYFDYCNTRFVFFDNATKVDSPEERLQWLEKVLSETPQNRKIIVAAHKPIGNIEKWSYHAMGKEHSEMFTDQMSKYNVEHVFFGHIHAYSTTTFNNVDYTISGGGGAGLHDRFGPQGKVHHYIICDVLSDGSLKQQVVRFYKEP
jgi:predicted MPP superfamily phosphohydrolase